MIDLLTKEAKVDREVDRNNLNQNKLPIYNYGKMSQNNKKDRKSEHM